jgi:hypothetical protein
MAGRPPRPRPCLIVDPIHRIFFLSFAAFGLAACPTTPPRKGLRTPPPTAASQPDGTKSTDLQLDLKLMWETQPLRNSGRFASTDPAIAAADRVFNTISLTGKTREEVIALLGDPRQSNNSQYNFPFWPVAREAMVYRFGCGNYGWQFNVFFDVAAKVKEVERQWIH